MAKKTTKEKNFFDARKKILKNNLMKKNKRNTNPENLGKKCKKI
jgi:hypothetical protein